MVGMSGQDVEMRNYSSSPTSLSSPPSGSLSEPGSPSRLNAGRANIATDEMDEIIVDLATGSRLNVPQTQAQSPAQQQQQYPEGVRLTVHGVPRKKPGRKPGSTVKPKTAADGSSTNTEAPKQRRPRKPRDPNAPPVQRKRKSAPPAAETPAPAEPTTAFTSASGRQPKITELTSMRMEIDSRAQSAAPSQPPPEKVVKREAIPTSMQSILNAEPPSHIQRSPPSQSSRGLSYDPIRSSTYDPVRETMFSRDPYGTGPLGSPRAPAQVPSRTSASPSIATLVDPPISSMRSPGQSYSTTTSASRFPESGSHPPSPSNAIRSVSGSASSAPKAAAAGAKNIPPLPSAPTTIKKAEEAKAAALGTINKDVTMSGTTSAPSKKVASVSQQERKPKGSSRASSPKITSVKDVMPPVPDLPERSILDFGKANPGDETAAPAIILHVPLNGETNKYVNFMRMAEEQYGWDALHPRLAAHRDRKARIAAASAALEKQGSGRESGDEMSVDLQSGDEGSNAEGPNGGTSGPDGAPAKPARKKRNFKEDEYDKDDDFVDDSEMLWEEQAAASRDGFFVYSGPLIQEEEKPAATEGPPKRGRGGRGRGGSTRGASGRGSRGGVSGSRGGSVARKPRITKLEKAQLDREKAERERLAQMTSKTGGSGLNMLSGANQSFSAGMVIDL